MSGANHSCRGVSIDRLILRAGVQNRIDIPARQARAVESEAQRNGRNHSNEDKFSGGAVQNAHEFDIVALRRLP